MLGLHLLSITVRVPPTLQWGLQSLSLCPGGCPVVLPHVTLPVKLPRKLTSTWASQQAAWPLLCQRTTLAHNTHVQKYMEMLISLQKQEKREQIWGYFYTNNESTFYQFLIPLHRRAEHEISECKQQSASTDSPEEDTNQDTPSNRTPYSLKASKEIFHLGFIYY